MAHLITRHDPYHVHKTLGMLSLLNFLLRIYYAVRYGTSFPPFESKTFACGCTLIHAALPLSSMFLPLPAKRNFNLPMIWLEFRLHSILFSCRHVVCTVVTILELWPTQAFGQTAGPMMAECVLKAGIVLSVVKFAHIITETHGSREQRTTNAMPYPENVSLEEQVAIKREYTKKQFGATMMAVFPGSTAFAATFAFAPLYAIQAAPFMMTLVRKGKCGSLAYHCVYATCLTYPVCLYHVFVRRGNFFFVDVAIGAVYMLTYNLRIHRRWTNEILWSVIVPLVVTVWIYIPQLEEALVPVTMRSNLYFGLWLVLVGREVFHHARTFAPFFSKKSFSENDSKTRLPTCKNHSHDFLRRMCMHARTHASIPDSGAFKSPSARI